MDQREQSVKKIVSDFRPLYGFLADLSMANHQIVAGKRCTFGILLDDLTHNWFRRGLIQQSLDGRLLVADLKGLQTLPCIPELFQALLSNLRVRTQELARSLSEK